MQKFALPQTDLNSFIHTPRTPVGELQTLVKTVGNKKKKKDYYLCTAIIYYL